MKEIFKRHPKFEVAPEDFESLPDDLWVRCPHCKELLYEPELEQALWVCSKCKYHFPLSAQQRVAVTVDPESFQEHDRNLHSSDPLHFQSPTERYSDKLKQYAARSNANEAFIYGTASVDSLPIVFGATEFKFCGGSLNPAVGEKLVRAVELAIQRRAPLVVVSTSGGARMQEGTLALFQMAKTVAALDQLHEAALPFVSIMADPCLGGTTASYAMLGDVNVAEPGAYIGFAGRRVIEQTMRQRLPQDAATAEFLLQHGMVDMVVARPDIPTLLARLLHVYCAGRRVQKESGLVGQPA